MKRNQNDNECNEVIIIIVTLKTLNLTVLHISNKYNVQHNIVEKTNNNVK